MTNKSWQNEGDESYFENESYFDPITTFDSNNGVNLTTGSRDEEEPVNRLKNQGVVSESVQEKDACKRRLTCFVLVGLVPIIIAALVAFLVIFLRRKDDDNGTSTKPSPTLSPTVTPTPTLQTILERGVLKCGVPSREFQGFSMTNPSTGKLEGFEIDSCKALAAAVLGDADKYETVELTAGDRFFALANRSIDVISRTTTHTMDRDVYQADAKTGFTFSVPYLYNGLGFGGKPSTIECADNAKTNGTCAELKICVVSATSHVSILKGLFPSWAVVETDRADRITKFNNNECNVLSGEQGDITESSVRLEGLIGDYEIGKKLVSKEPLALVTRDGDPEWSQIVNWVLQAQFFAEAMNITQETANDFPLAPFFGDEYDDMFVKVIAAVGNYGERYERYLEDLIPRQGLNVLNLNEEYVDAVTNKSLGLIYSHPWGSIDEEGPKPSAGSRLDTIARRGILRCGITKLAPGFAEIGDNLQGWKGLDVDYCEALAASIFDGVVSSTVEYVLLDATSNRSIGFEALANGDVDVLSGVNIDLESNVKEEVSFSPAYYYEENNGARALATNNGDSQFSDFVWWIVTATFYAEEQGITQRLSTKMPLINAWGSQYVRALRDAILAEGNYGEIYERNLEALIPRTGRNNLNKPSTGPQINPFAGLEKQRI